MAELVHDITIFIILKSLCLQDPHQDSHVQLNHDGNSGWGRGGGVGKYHKADELKKHQETDSEEPDESWGVS